MHELYTAPLPEVLCELMRRFYVLGWVSGTGGGISIKDPAGGYWLAPSGVHKELLSPDDLFRFEDDLETCVEPRNGGKLTECFPLFQTIFRARGAGAVIHSHSIWSSLVTRVCEGDFSIVDFEMQKGISGHGVFSPLRVPIIANTEREPELTGALAEALERDERAFAVLVRGHGVYIWGDDWKQAKRHAECYDYLFRAKVELARLGQA